MEVWKEFEHNEITHSIAHHLMAVNDLLNKHGYSRVTDVAKTSLENSSVMVPFMIPVCANKLNGVQTKIKRQVKTAASKFRFNTFFLSTIILFCSILFRITHFTNFCVNTFIDTEGAIFHIPCRNGFIRL